MWCGRQQAECIGQKDTWIVWIALFAWTVESQVSFHIQIWGLTMNSFASSIWSPAPPVVLGCHRVCLLSSWIAWWTWNPWRSWQQRGRKAGAGACLLHSLLGHLVQLQGCASFCFHFVMDYWITTILECFRMFSCGFREIHVSQWNSNFWPWMQETITYHISLLISLNTTLMTIFWLLTRLHISSSLSFTTLVGPVGVRPALSNAPSQRTAGLPRGARSGSMRSLAWVGGWLFESGTASLRSLCKSIIMTPKKDQLSQHRDIHTD